MMNWYFALGDLDFFWKEQLQSLSWLPQVFRLDMGFGESGLLRLWLDYPFRLVLKTLTALGLTWFIIEKLLWISVFVLAVYSSYRLARYVLGKNPCTYLAPVVYAANTYFLLLFSGGQIGVAWAYALAPFVLLKFTERNTIANGLWLALLVAFDLRIAYLVAAAIVLYMMLDKKFSSFYSFGASLLVAASVHLYWILPTVLAGADVSVLGGQFTGPGMLKFLSFADFSHALAFLHPNWPENLFGKVYFLRPEFLVIPILAFASLLFNGQRTINNKHSNRLLFTAYCPFFALLSLIGAFFAKGANEPFGGVFQWMFTHVPGFVMFRDPTKFYLYTAIGYSVLIPFVLERINKKAIFFIFVIYWIFTIRALFMGEVRGNFRPIQLTEEYVQLKNLLVADPVPSRTLWIPQQDPFVYKSDVHPLLTANELYNNASVSAMIRIIQNPEFIRTLAASGVKYVAVPEDPGKRIFLDDYQFDPREREALVGALGKTTLMQDAGFGNLAVFENSQFTMQKEIPSYVKRQQEYAYIGLGLSVVSLILYIGFLCRMRD